MNCFSFLFFRSDPIRFSFCLFRFFLCFFLVSSDGLIVCVPRGPFGSRVNLPFFLHCCQKKRIPTKSRTQHFAPGDRLGHAKSILVLRCFAGVLFLFFFQIFDDFAFTFFFMNVTRFDGIAPGFTGF